jgi:membrane protein implicated in regulation of membrane protease activity
MFIYAYVFALVLGGVLLAASMVLGGKDLDGGADASHDVGDHDVDHGSHGDHASDHGDASHGNLGGFFAVLVSMRFWTFFATFFGLTGLVLEGLEFTSNVWLARGLAIGVGFLTGWATVKLIRHLAANESGVAAGVDDYVGRSGEVLIRIVPGSLGKVRIELKGTTVDVLAVMEDDDVLEAGAHALIVEMRGTQALVTKIAGKPVEHSARL